MGEKIPNEKVTINYKNCLKFETLYDLAWHANKLGLEGKRITGMKARASFGEGVIVEFELEKPL